MTSNEIITHLSLEPHPTEGGYFRRTYEADLRCDTENGSRMLLTSIYYMLIQDSPGGFLHRNKSDILHYHHLAQPSSTPSFPRTVCFPKKFSDPISLTVRACNC